MWKSLNPGEKVFKGDTVRYKTDSSNLSPSKEEIYHVTKVDLHYFEIAIRAEIENDDESDRKIIKYMDIGYHLGLETWLDHLQDQVDNTKQITG